jgi:DNA adenine methylase
MSKGCFGWPGGKRSLAPKIIKLIPKHVCYVEPFCGSAKVMFLKDQKSSKVEVINDINKELVNFFKVLRDSEELLIDRCLCYPNSRCEFYNFKSMNIEGMSELERAVRFLYLQQASFGGVGVVYGTSKVKQTNWNLNTIELSLESAHKRIRGVTIECLPYDELIARYDAETTFFYVDPPYYNSRDIYGKGLFTVDDYSKLATILKNIKGKFLMSIDDCEETRELFNCFKFLERSVTYTISKSIAKTSNPELLIYNYELPCEFNATLLTNEDE